MMRWVVILLLVGLSAHVAAGQRAEPTPAAEPSPAVEPTQAPGLGRADLPVDCPNLSSDLQQLVAAPDRDAFSAQRALSYAAGEVRVTVFLLQADTPLPTAYGLTEEVRFDDVVQVLAPVDALCALASDPSVRRVETPAALAF